MNKKSGPIFFLVAIVFFSVMTLEVKMASAVLPHKMVVFFRNLMALLVLLPNLFRSTGWRHLKTEHLYLHFLRAGTGLLAMYCNFFAIAKLPLAEATLLYYTAPLFLPIFAWLFLQEEVLPRMWAGILVGMSGVVFMVKPGAALLDPVAIIGLCSGISSALTQVVIRRMTHCESDFAIVFYFPVMGTIVSGLPLLAGGWDPTWISIWPTLLLMGATAVAAQYFLAKAHACGAAGTLAPLACMALGMAAVIDWMVYSQLPDVWMLIGMSLTLVGGALAIRSPRRRPVAQAS